MKLWSESLENHREEARNMLELLPKVATVDPPSDPIARAEAQRAGFREMLPPIPPSERAEPARIPGPRGRDPGADLPAGWAGPGALPASPRGRLDSR